MRVQELFDLHGKVAIVTGGGSGLGRQMADSLAECGADLVLCARDGERCERGRRARSPALGVRALGLACDVREPRARSRRSSSGPWPSSDASTSSSTTPAPRGAPGPRTSHSQGWQKVIDVNLTGAFLFAQAVGRVLIAAGRGRKDRQRRFGRGLPRCESRGDERDPYNASKGGLVAMTIDLAVKWARHRICVNALAPGWFPSEMSEGVLERSGGLLLDRIPLGRFGGADDLKGAIAYLASPRRTSSPARRWSSTAGSSRTANAAGPSRRRPTRPAQ